MKIRGSKTTKNVAQGVGLTAGTVGIVLIFIRYMWPDLLPWEVGKDMAVDAFAATFIGPLVSQFIAMRKNPEKRTQWEKTEGKVTSIRRTKMEG